MKKIVVLLLIIIIILAILSIIIFIPYPRFSFNEIESIQYLDKNNQYININKNKETSFIKDLNKCRLTYYNGNFTKGGTSEKFIIKYKNGVIRTINYTDQKKNDKYYKLVLKENDFDKLKEKYFLKENE